MTNIYDVLSEIQVKATANAKKAVEEDLKKEDPPLEEAKAILEENINEEVEPEPESADESTEGDDEE